MGEGVWGSFPEEVRRLLTQIGPALLAEFQPPEQRDMTEKMAGVLSNARLVRVGGGHLIDPAAAEVLAFIEEVLETR